MARRCVFFSPMSDLSAAPLGGLTPPQDRFEYHIYSAAKLEISLQARSTIDLPI